MEGLGQHLPALESCWSIQQKQTIACAGDRGVHECVNSEIKRKNGHNLIHINGEIQGKKSGKQNFLVEDNKINRFQECK